MTTSKPGPASATWTCVCGERINNFDHTCKQGDGAPRSAAEAAEGTRPAGQAEQACWRCGQRRFDHDYHGHCPLVSGWSRVDTFAIYPEACLPKPAAGVEPPVVAVAGREASATVEQRHREAAWSALYPTVPFDEPRHGWQFSVSVSGNKEAGLRVAQALANAEAYGRASALEKP